MRILHLASLTMAVGLVVAAHEPLAAQTAPRATNVSSQNAANRAAPRSVVTGQQAAPRNQQVPSTQTRNAPNSPAVADQSDRIVGEIRSMEQNLEQANRLLQQRLAKAEQIRQQGLKKEDQRLLQQAEQMDRQAIAAYQQQLKQFEVFSQRIGQTSQARAQQAAARANGTPSPVQNRARGNNAAGNSGQSNTGANQNFAPRGLFRFGGR